MNKTTLFSETHLSICVLSSKTEGRFRREGKTASSLLLLLGGRVEESSSSEQEDVVVDDDDDDARESSR